MELVNVDTSATGIVEDANANEEQNASEGDIIRNRLTNQEANLYELTENVTQLFIKLDDLTKAVTKLQGGLTENVKKLQDKLTENVTHILEKQHESKEIVTNLLKKQHN